MTNHHFSVEGALRHGWSVFKSHKRTLIAATFVLMVIGALQNVLNRTFKGFGFSSVILWIALFIVATVVQIGWLKIFLKLEDGEPTGLRELYEHSKLFLKYFLTSVCYGLITFLGFVIFIIPGFYFLIKYAFAPLIVIDEHITLTEAFRRSALMTRGVKWRLLWFGLVLAVLNLVGAVLLLVGLFVTIPLTTAAYIYVYRRLLERATEAKIEA